MATGPLLHSELTEQVIGGFYAVYNDLGYGYLEAPYANALAVELGARGLVVKREVPVRIVYRGVPVGYYRYDMLVNGQIIVEVKANIALSNADHRQLLNYLKAGNIEVGLLVNFGPEAKYVRKVNTGNPRKSA